MYESFPRMTFKGLSGTQVGVGIVIIIIGICDVFLTIHTFASCDNSYLNDEIQLGK